MDARLASLLLALAFCSGPTASASAGAEDILRVPAGHVEDRLVYAAFHRSAAGPESLERQPWQAAGGQLFEVLRAAETLDAQGRLRPAIVVATNQSFPLLLAATASDGKLRQRASGTTHEYVDLATRDVVRADARAGSVVLAGFEARRPSLRGLNYQGLQLRPSQDLSYATDEKDIPRLDAAFYFAFEFPMFLGTLSISGLQRANATYFDLLPPGTPVHRWVHQKGILRGEEAWGIRTELTVTYPEEARSPAPAGKTLEIRQDEWVSASSPYVLLVQRWATLRDAAGHPESASEAVVDLAEFNPGRGAAIQWRDPGCCPARAPQRQASDGLPADGPGPGLAFPAEEALRDANQHTGMVLWAAQHPSARVVAARLERGPTSEAGGTRSASLAWTFCWRDQNGSARAVLVERRPDVPVAITQDSACPQAAGTDGDPPSAPITFADASWRARAVWPDERAPDYVLWGDMNPNSSGSPGACPMWAGDPTKPDELESRPFRTLVIGWTEAGSCYAPQSGVATSQVVLDTESGRPLWGLQSSEGFDRTLPLLSGERPDLPAAPRSFQGAFPELPGAVLVFGWSATLVAVLGALAYLLRHVGPLAGYSKIREDKLLDHPARRTLHDAIQADPGVHSADLARRVGLSWSSVRHHLRLMAKAGLVSSFASGRTRSWFAARDPERWPSAVALRNPVAARILERVRARPGATVQEVAADVDLTTAGVLWHLQRLEAAGLLSRQKVGRSVHLHPRSPAPVAKPE